MAASRKQVTVAGETSNVSLGSTTSGGVVTTRQIAELPLNGRSFMQLATLQPGVITSRGTAKDFTGGFGSTQLAIGGARPEQTGYLMDGTNIADISDKAPSSLSGVLLGVDTVQEFSVQTHGYSAEFGRAAGGVMSTVTKSGTNQMRGSLFEFHRDDALGLAELSSRPAICRPSSATSSAAPSAGRSSRTKLFYFGSYEQLRERNAVTQHARLPNALAHQGIVPNANGALVNVGVHATTRPYLDLLFPIPDGVDFGDGTAELVHSHQDPTDEHFGVVKFDYNLGRKDTLHGALVARRLEDGPVAVRTRTSSSTRPPTPATSRRRISTCSARNLLNVLRFAANRTARTDDLLPTIEIPTSLYFSTDPHFGAIDIVNVSTAGSIATTPVDYKQDVYQLSDTLTWNKNSHVMKAGFDFQNYHFDGFSFSRYGGTFRFRNVQEFLTLQRSATAQADRFTGNLPGTDTFREMRQKYAAFFVQDDWRASSHLSMQAGLRYDFVTDPKELNGKVAGPAQPRRSEHAPRRHHAGHADVQEPVEEELRAASRRRVEPVGRQEVDGQGGLRPVLPAADDLLLSRHDVPHLSVLRGRRHPPARRLRPRQHRRARRRRQPRPRCRSAPSSSSTTRSSRSWSSGTRTSTATSATSMVAEIGYLGSKGHNLPFYGDPNNVPSAYGADGVKRLVPGATLRYPSWGRIRTRINEARSIYHGLTASWNKRYSHNWQAQASYTYGNAHDTWSGGQIGGSDFDNGAGSATDWWDPEDRVRPVELRHPAHARAQRRLRAALRGSRRTGFVGALIRRDGRSAASRSSRAACRSRRSSPTIRSATARATPACRSRTSTER